MADRVATAATIGLLLHPDAGVHYSRIVDGADVAGVLTTPPAGGAGGVPADAAGVPITPAGGAGGGVCPGGDGRQPGPAAMPATASSATTATFWSSAARVMYAPYSSFTRSLWKVHGGRPGVFI
jgi:hypothetical protein